MTEVSKHIYSLLQYLNKNSEYALLRNYEGLPDDNSSRDIDIVISRKEYSRCKDALLEVLTQNQWYIFSYLDNGRLITYVMAKMQGKNINLVQWDFFTDTSVHGIRLLSAQQMLSSRSFNGVLYHVSREYEFLDKYLYNRVVGAEYPSKYNDIRSEVEHSDIVAGELKRLFGCSDMDKVDAMSGLLYSAFLRNMLKAPFSTLISVICSIVIYIASYLKPSVAPTLAFTGADGAGKTTIIEMIEHKLSAVYGKATKTFHFRPTIISNLGELAHSAGVKKEVDREYSNPHRGAKSSVLSSFCRLCYYTFDYILGYWLRVKPQSRIIKLIIFDRYYSDIIVDSRRSSIYLNRRFLYLWGRVFIPSMRYNFLITADTNTILSRKQELLPEDIERITINMEYLSKKKGYYLIENNHLPESSIQQIMSIIITEQHKRNIRRI
ncbi:MAG: hypothetical protein R3Y15_02725 [Rikenellaceae bacterium]